MSPFYRGYADAWMGKPRKSLDDDYERGYSEGVRYREYSEHAYRAQAKTELKTRESKG